MRDAEAEQDARLAQQDAPRACHSRRYPGEVDRIRADADKMLAAFRAEGRTRSR